MNRDAVADLSFEDLIAPVACEEFFANHWDRGVPLVLSRNGGDLYRSLFSMEDIDRSIYSARQCAQKNLNIIPPAGSDRPMRSYLPGALSSHEIYQAFSSGETVRFMAVQASWPPLARFSSMMSEVFGAKVNVNFYLTPASSQGFPVHIDTHDAFILQITGAKEWFLYEKDDYEYPLNSLEIHQSDLTAQFKSPLEDDEVTLARQVRLEAGDLLFLPRGVPHKAVAAEGAPSLHLTVGIHSQYWVDYAKAAMEWLAVNEPALRAPLPRGFATDPEVAAEMSDRFVEILSRALDGASFDDTTARLVNTYRAGRSFPPDGHLARLLEIDEIDPDTVVERRAGLVCHVSSEGEVAFIHFGGHKVQGPVRLAPVFGFVSDRRRFRVGELPGLDDQSCVILVRRLVRDGLLRMVSPSEQPAIEAHEPVTA